jgi:putative DNA methylase
MADMKPYPKHFIEIDRPIREMFAHALREKSIRHGHISALHLRSGGCRD